jgi:hypothetical protein
MRALLKIGLVGTAFAAAFAVAGAALQAYVLATAGVDRQAYGGMSAFGDSVYFLAAFALAAIPATALGLYFLRPHAWFWQGLRSTGIVVAGTSTTALLGYVARLDSAWAMLSPLLFLAAPFFGGLFLLSGLIAPSRRGVLFATTAVQFFVFACVVALWTHRTG